MEYTHSSKWSHKVVQSTRENILIVLDLFKFKFILKSNVFKLLHIFYKYFDDMPCLIQWKAYFEEEGC